MSEEEPREIGLIGQAAKTLELQGYLQRKIAFYAVDREFLSEENELLIPLDDPSDQQKRTEVVCALGAPGQKRNSIERWPGRNYAIVIAREAFVASHLVEIGTGTIVAPNATVMAGVEIGNHVLVNTGAIVSHESKIGDYSTISPGVQLGGRVVLGRGVFVGIGATIRDGVVVGDGAVIGAGALVLEDVGDLEVVVGAPARVLRYAKEWIRRI